jgi:hypothetical protein
MMIRYPRREDLQVIHDLRHLLHVEHELKGVLPRQKVVVLRKPTRAVAEDGAGLIQGGPWLGELLDRCDAHDPMLSNMRSINHGRGAIVEG